MSSMFKESGFRVISGGQTGVDLAGLRAAQCMGLRTGGFAPLGWRTQHGPKPELQAFGLVEATSKGYGDRTEANVVAADATLLIYAKGDSPGTVQTRKFAKHHGRPVHEIDISKSGPVIDLQPIIAWLQPKVAVASALNGTFTLNVAGNSSMTASGIWVPAFLTCLNVFYKVAHDTDGGPEEEDRGAIYRVLRNGGWRQLIDVFDYIPQLDFRNRYRSKPVENESVTPGETNAQADATPAASVI